jgi:tetratricopeptide (TPR) repeat protein
LAGGTGTVAFLIGLARFDEGALRVEQLVVPQLGAEAPVLAQLAERIASASCLITYNGKSFDWPLLRTRFVLSRLPIPELPPHLDLLHICRRLWKERLDSVRLTDMEREVLRFEREDDLPGAEIPARYFEFLRGGSPDRLCPVLEHNQNDLIALAALLGAVMDQFDRTRALTDPSDALYFGKVALRARELDRARAFGEDALAHSTCAWQTRAALIFCAEIELKLGRVPEAVALLQRVLGHRDAIAEADGDELARVHFALAKLYEHELRDFARALSHARNTEPVEGPELQARRLGRLYRRLLRGAEGTA